ncbi:lactoylglutathione lyase [Roseateles asaccharophilus]|uniref:lactoylglutathione lyase n=1 Tax=Roseateles asaccharophilus TaxID=582607 RepID=A0ABU2AFM7_9BURK|nr:lactoylglutathione lyase [Roseateles asaccharophilus]MDR7336021.1 lactoylglutathione lyase [Roseateles asaccharophilus]
MRGLPLQRPRLLHTMLRVRNLDVALGFYVGKLGMRLLRRQDFLEGRFTLAFVGYADEGESTVLELTENWEAREYELGSAYGHIAIGVPDVFEAAEALRDAGVPITREPGPLNGSPDEVIAFVNDPDGYRVELIQR